MEAFIGEIRMFTGNFAPTNWHICDGSLLNIQANQALYSILGTLYGGDGVNTFGLPNLQGRVPMHWGVGNGQSYQIAQATGSETVVLTQSQIPPHSHTITGTNIPGDTPDPTNNYLAQQSGVYSGDTVAVTAFSQTLVTATTMNSATITPAGTSTPHNNMQPFLTVNFIINISGYYPSRN